MSSLESKVGALNENVARIASALETIAFVLETETKRGGALRVAGIESAIFEVADAVNNQEANR